MAERDPSPAVTRSLSILELLAASEGRPLPPAEIARRLGIAKSSTINLISALEEGGMISRTLNGCTLGRATAEIGGAYAEQFNQAREFYSACEASELLRSHVVQMTVLAGLDALYLARHEGRRRFRLGTPLGSRLPAALTATGNAHLMRMSDEEVIALVGPTEPFPQLTQDSVRDLGGLLEKIRESRSRGYAVDVNESVHGVTGVAVPLEPWTPSDPPFALGVPLPSEEASPETIGAVAEALQQAADTLSNPFARSVS
ncbi:IclR family transcriptional regulator [Nesterenkonia cremea]|uniref:ArsR family transcriptional regulator n=1 Tax=Nesterenkonia cremea TaxID=1882340 RepID=A0A917AU48_9MICC|nr:IclR family transcriptional regulator [Nesterenkonia cremea]GGE74866.1 ArsR family transcriptional regulator [Nesterenkonia cremea]